MSKVIKNWPWPAWIPVQLIGKGSYGSVYKVERDNPTLGKEYAAVKMVSIPKSEEEISALRADGMSEQTVVEYYDNITKNFVKEIQMMTQFKGLNNIVSIEDHKVFKKPEGIGSDIFIRMELLSTMEQYTKNHTLTQDEVIKLGCDMCSALEKCSELSIIHRDIKPANIFVNRFGDFKLGDFGIARTLSDTTNALSQRGTFDYMAPEVYNGTHYDSRVDIYSLGLVLYKYLNNGFMPFISDNAQLANPTIRTEAFNRRMRGEAFAGPSQAGTELQKVILKACSYNPDDRYATALEMHQALERVKRGQPAEVAPQQSSYMQTAAMPAAMGGAAIAASQVQPYAAPSYQTPSNPIPQYPASPNPASPYPAMNGAGQAYPSQNAPRPYPPQGYQAPQQQFRPGYGAAAASAQAAPSDMYAGEKTSYAGGPRKPSEPSEKSSSQGKNKQKLIVAICSIALIVALGAGVIIWLVKWNPKDDAKTSKKTTKRDSGEVEDTVDDTTREDFEFQLTEDYVTISFEGYEGYGKAKAEVNWAVLEKDLFEKDPNFNVEELKKCIQEGKIDPSSKLKNGDIVQYEWLVDKGAAQKNCGVILDSSIYVHRKVEGLAQVTTFDPFDGISVSFDGVNGFGQAKVVGAPTVAAAQQFSYTLSKSDSLSNGDEITIVFNWNDSQSDAFIEANGCYPATRDKRIVVSGLPAAYIGKSTEITSQQWADMENFAINKLKDSITKKKSSNLTIEMTNLLGYYTLIPRSNPGQNQSHVCLVYQVWIKEIVNGYEIRREFFRCMTFHNVYADGTIVLDDEHSDVSGDAISFGSWKINGFYNYDSLYKTVVAKNSNDYYCEMNVNEDFIKKYPQVYSRDGMFLKDFDMYVVDENTLHNYTDNELQFAIDDILASYGFIFSSKRQNKFDYYIQYPWYHPCIPGDEFNAHPDNYITDPIAKKNFDNLVYERDHTRKNG